MLEKFRANVLKLARRIAFWHALKISTYMNVRRDLRDSGNPP